MFDKQKLAKDLAAMCRDDVRPILAAPHSPLDEKMDRFDLERGYVNLGTTEYPIWGRPQMYSLVDLYAAYLTPLWTNAPTYGGIARNTNPTQSWASSPRSMFQVTGFDVADKPEPETEVESPHDKLKAEIVRLAESHPVTIEAPPAKKPVPDYVQALTGWRGWQTRNGRLEALAADKGWEPKNAVRASCNVFAHDAPQMQCSCGYWSFKTLDMAKEAMGNYVDAVEVIGTVAIWGRVIECENGYRSEYAYPTELWLLREGLEHLGHIYGVPIRK